MTQVVKFLEHISNSDNTLVNEIYTNIPQNNNWLLTVHKWLNELGYGYLLSKTHLLKHKISSIKQRIIDQSMQIQLSSLKESRKLIFLKKN